MDPMAERKNTPKKKAAPKSRSTRKKQPSLVERGWFWLRRVIWGACFAVLGFVLLATLVYAVVPPPTTPYMLSERARIGSIKYDWTPIEQIAPVMARSAVAAEDANFCLHWGLDVNAIRDAMDRGRGGASTISQQVIKNTYLWHGRSWLRKAIEALWTPLSEAVWSKRRILELYLNIAEFDEGVFGVQAAAGHYFGVDAADLTPTQAARLAAILPAPKSRSASNPSPFVRDRTRAIISGAQTIAADGRAECFEN
ncbi:monofunctional biosynthetic peptidoglycan transglycosylase [Yoonia tamlensis]|uniref:Biosynthetic peptidoglycan transglycosylase n=2 Tax=Yoonia tamlensis TaxID=390270 RepID=A0A1I6HD91_9RHOB|nr:monofunctional biosynthetic peptidoglycan transglycosylase [Yoonia tamlensis]